MPLLEEAMMDVSNEPLLQYSLFGCFMALKNEQVHAGYYGSDGNIRFHLVMRKRCGEASREDQSNDFQIENADECQSGRRNGN